MSTSLCRSAEWIYSCKPAAFFCMLVHEHSSVEHVWEVASWYELIEIQLACKIGAEAASASLQKNLKQWIIKKSSQCALCTPEFDTILTVQRSHCCVDYVVADVSSVHKMDQWEVKLHHIFEILLPFFESGMHTTNIRLSGSKSAWCNMIFKITSTTFMRLHMHMALWRNMGLHCSPTPTNIPTACYFKSSRSICHCSYLWILCHLIRRVIKLTLYALQVKVQIHITTSTYLNIITPTHTKVLYSSTNQGCFETSLRVCMITCCKTVVTFWRSIKLTLSFWGKRVSTQKGYAGQCIWQVHITRLLMDPMY